MKKKGIALFAIVSLVMVCMGRPLFAEPSNAVATVNGVDITTEIFEKRMRRLTGEGQGSFDSFEGKKELLDILIAREVLNQKGR
ncbi:MAG: SurA N-terminal domain-containing protein, partial [Nitrospiria bacterium]